MSRALERVVPRPRSPAGSTREGARGTSRRPPSYGTGPGGELLQWLASAAQRPAAVAVPARAEPGKDPARVRAAALEGLRGGGGSLPHLDRIQRSFGRHDVTGVVAHTGAQASAAARAMGAAAFTTGGHVAFAAPPDLRVAAHEAAHVVQQRGGVQLSGGVGAAGDPCERHADAVADLVVQGRSSAALLDRYAGGVAPLPGFAGPVAAPAGDVVQRAIGYEVELGTVGVRPRPGALPPPALTKGLVLWRGSGWDASVDDLPGGGFDLELRTEPIDDLAAGGRSRAETRLQAIAAVWQRIDAANAIQPASHYDGSASPDIVIDARFAPHYAQIQASAGLRLDALQAIRSGAALAAMGAHPGAGYLGQGGVENPNIAPQIAGRLPNIRAALGLLPGENINNMAAVIGMILEIPVNSWHVNAPYPKGFAGGLMARTDFATILRQLPPNQARAIATHADAWRGELMHIARVMILQSPHAPAHVNRRTAIFRPGSTPSAGQFGGRLRMGDWFRDLALGTDRLTAADYSTRHPGRAEAADLESLGSYGGRMDAGSYSVSLGSALELVSGAALMVAGTVASFAPVEGAAATGGVVGGIGAAMVAHGAAHVSTPDRNRPIFELRALGSPDVANLVNAGLAVWDYVDQAHGRNPGGPNQLGLARRLWNWLGSR